MKLRKLMSLVFLGTFLTGCGVEVVDTGHRGVKTRFGKVVGESLPEGLYFYNPITSNIIEMDTRVQKWANKTECYTKDVQQVMVNFAVNYSLQKTSAHTVFQEVGIHWADRLLPQIVEGNLKAVIGQYPAVSLIENRLKATRDAEQLIVSTAKSRNITITKLELTNLQFEPEFEKAVEAKVVAIQKASEAKNRTVEIEEQAKQKLISAEAEAKSMSIRAQALTKNKSLVEYEAIQKWDGKLPQYVMGGATPFINMTPKMRN